MRVRGRSADGRVPGEGETELGQREAAPPQLEAVVAQVPAEHEAVSSGGHQGACAGRHCFVLSKLVDNCIV